MSSEQDQVRQLAERIARRVRQSAEPQPQQPAASANELNGEMAAMRRSLSELKERLAQLEGRLVAPEEHAARASSATRGGSQASVMNSSSAEAAPATRSPWLSGMYVPAAHPSQEKFGVEEAAVSELVDFFEGAKKCELEPGGKPCDHCSMCNSRGF